MDHTAWIDPDSIERNMDSLLEINQVQFQLIIDNYKRIQIAIFLLNDTLASTQLYY